MGLPSIHTTVDLSLLPSPKVVTTPNFETLLTANVALFQSIDPTYTMLLESDPVLKLIQLFTYKELHLIEYANEVARQNLLSFASGSDLDHLVSSENIVRMAGETDEALRYRFQVRKASKKGSYYHYKDAALSADVRVRDAEVFSPDAENGVNMGGRVVVAILSNEDGLFASEELIEVVSMAVGGRDSKILSDIVEVVPAAQKEFSVDARIRLYPTAPQSTVAALRTAFTAAFEEAQALGQDITRSWIVGKLQAKGVHSVELVSPAEDVIVRPNEYPVMTALAVTFAGTSDQEGVGVVHTEEEKVMRSINKFYVDYARTNKRTHAQIMSDLLEKGVPGALQPTVRSVAEYLTIPGIKDAEGEYLPEDEIAFLIYTVLSPSYAA